MSNDEILHLLHGLEQRGVEVTIIDRRHAKEYYVNGKIVETIFKDGVTEEQKRRHLRIYN